ncbi:PQQ-binding-like beta-propeller repeat protein [Elioraea sp.]|uniref:outer membrane protein assembly factor BamB family protein n=1 Tax=Elioraea sp. TaxID=2185103 RepID=UPI0021DCC527|nr:PQQ-binding-like beta-propeller repeat protein [Elioraea sp.]GIX08830.1 MAG: pyrrolo-quinoline quinone [Elioraea sp.]
MRGRGHLSRRALIATLPLATGGCGLWDWAFEDTKKPLPGERRTVLPGEAAAAADPSLSDLPVELPPPVPNAAWPVPGGSAANAMGHLAAADTLAVAWRTSIGTGGSRRRPLLTTPVVAEGRVYVSDAVAEISALDAATGRTVWRADARPRENRGSLLGAGLAHDGGRLFVATGLAEVMALDAATGAEIWRSPLPTPTRGAINVAEGRVVVLTVEGQVVAYSAETGERLWTHRGPSETTTLLGAPAPAIDDGIVLAGFPNGDIAAIRLDTGRAVWTEGIAGIRGRPSIADIAAVRGRPAIDRGRGIVTGAGGVTMAIDMRSGRRIWEREIPGRESPWVAGDWIFMLSESEEAAALRRADGRVKWVTPLPRFADEQRRRDPITWTGPLLVGDRLVVGSSRGEALALSPYTGEILGRQRLPDGVTVPMVVADQTVFLLTDGATLVALR